MRERIMRIDKGKNIPIADYFLLIKRDDSDFLTFVISWNDATDRLLTGESLWDWGSWPRVPTNQIVFPPTPATPSMSICHLKSITYS